MKVLSILIDDESHTVTVVDSEGDQHVYQGIVLFAGDAQMGTYSIIADGASADAAWAFAQGFSREDMKNFYRQACCHIVQRIDSAAFQQKATAESILDRWEEGKKATH